MENIFLQDWKESQYEKLVHIFPMLTKDKIMEVIQEDIDKNFEDRESMLHNDYNDDMELTQPLTLIYRFAKERKPILAGNGTLFYDQNKKSSPIADLIDDRIATRAFYKNKMKDAKRQMNHYEKGSPEYNELKEQAAYFNMMQMEAKVRINSIYGSFGTPSFQLYNKYTAAATTGTAQSLISETGIAFEAFFGDHVLFKSLGECIVFITNIVKEEYDLPPIDMKYITDKEIIYERMVNNFAKGCFNEDTMGDLLMDYIENVGVVNWTKIYYKNNLEEFIRNPGVKALLQESFSSIDNFNDPNVVPEQIEPIMNQFWQYCKEWVFYNHPYREQINRLKNDTRKVVKLIDTDSNLVYVQPFVDFLQNEILDLSEIRMTGDTLDFACVNTLAYTITEMLRTLLWDFCDNCNILDRFRHRINMKNEFCFLRLLLGPTKKRYAAKIVLQEGIPVSQTEIKGFDFKKAGITEYASEKLTKILEDRVLFTDTVDIKGILQDLDAVEKELYSSLKKGERNYLLRMNCKFPEAYKNPYSMGQVLSVLAWNTICPDDEIVLPDKLDVVLLDVPNEAALEPIRESYPREYDRINRLILNGPVKTFREKGLKYLAIPNSFDKVPDWVIPLINYDYISSRNLGTFNPIMVSLGLPPIGSKQQNHFGNIRFDREVYI